MSKRSEKAKRLNANEDNLLQKEMERFEKQHNKEMKNILLERQVAKEVMGDLRRYRASSLLAAQMALQEDNASNNHSDIPQRNDLFGRSRTPAQTFTEGTTTSKMTQSSETHEDLPLLGKTFLPSPAQKMSNINPKSVGNLSEPLLASKIDKQGQSCAILLNARQKTPNLDNECQIDFNYDVTTLPSRNERTRAQTFSEGTTISKVTKSLESHEGIQLFRKTFLPSPGQKMSDVNPKSLSNLSVPLIDKKGQSCARPRSFTEGTTKARSNLEEGSSSERTELDPITFCKNSKLKNQYREQQGNSAANNVLIVNESVEEGRRPRSRSDEAMLFKRLPTPRAAFEKGGLTAIGPSSPRSKENSPEPESFHSCPSLRVPLSPQIKRRVSLDASRLLSKRSSLQLLCMPLTEPPKRELSPSRGIAKFRQTGSAASAAQTLVSRYQREKAISKATENLIVERQKREKVHQEHQQMKEDWTKAGRNRKTGLKERFFTVAQLVMALNALKKAANRRSSFAQEKID